MILARNRDELRTELDRLRGSGRVALVPTMGFLHEGHLSLVDQARDAADLVVVSIFVNPLQFGPGEDLADYPRDEVRDLESLRARGVDLVFLPGVADIYPGGEPVVTVSPGAMERCLCGAFRPGHFRGVLTVVAKLFGLVRPDVAIFGSKDFQQSVLIRRMVRDLELGVEIRVGHIVREADGLAMSSRNAYLSADERQEAAAINRVLDDAVGRFAMGERRASKLTHLIGAEIAAHELLALQYVEIVNPETLESVSEVQVGSAVALAAFCGTTRLIDNHVFG